jgi:hypothetical protein
MPARNRYHEAVRDALITDGWTITHDPLTLLIGERPLLIDLGAERPGGGVVAVELLAIEVQTFPNPSPVADLQQALGQYVMYRRILSRQQPDRTLYLAVPFGVADGILAEPLGQEMADEVGLKLIVFHPTDRRILRWTS